MKRQLLLSSPDLCDLGNVQFLFSFRTISITFDTSKLRNMRNWHTYLPTRLILSEKRSLNKCWIIIIIYIH